MLSGALQVTSTPVKHHLKLNFSRSGDGTPEKHHLKAKQRSEAPIPVCRR